MGRVGKTHLLERYAYGRVPEARSICPCFIKVVPRPQGSPTDTAKLLLWDPKDSVVDLWCRLLMRGAGAVILAYDPCNRQSFARSPVPACAMTLVFLTP